MGIMQSDTQPTLPTAVERVTRHAVGVTDAAAVVVRGGVRVGGREGAASAVDARPAVEAITARLARLSGD